MCASRNTDKGSGRLPFDPVETTGAVGHGHREVSEATANGEGSSDPARQEPWNRESSDRPSRPRLRDQSARDAIASRLDRNVLVEAGAGSGKTHEMARRMASGVASGTYAVNGMAAVTFTRKAASELRGRFQAALEDLLAGRGPRSLHDVEKERVRGALANLERFFAGTIHSFCAHLLRERPVEAGVSPGFSELDEVEDAILRRQSWRDYVSQQLAAGDPLMLELRDAGVKPSDLDDAFGIVTLYEEVEFPPGDAEKPDATGAWEALDTFWAALRQKLPSAMDAHATCPTQRAARRFPGQMRVADTGRRLHRTLADLLETWKFEPGITQKWWPGNTAARKQVRDEIVALHEPFREGVVLPFLERWRHYVYRLGVTLLIRARGFAAQERRRLNVLNYGDLLQLAVRVLRDDPAVRRALQQKYRWLFVDEFQDTDPVQAEIIFLLASDPDASAHSRRSDRAGASRRPDATDRADLIDWRTLPLRPGALFVVGDPEQSIYRFRRADIDVYNVVRARLDDPPVSAVLPLTTNFRSIPALCDWANTAFVTEFPRETTIQSPRFQALDAAPVTSAGAVHPHRGVFTLTMPETCDRGHVAEEEADRIARYIRSEVAAGRRTFGDFLVLTRRKRSLSLYADALERVQAPIEVSGAGAFRESSEVAQLALLLRALGDPQDAVSLVGVLRGPLFGISDVDLFAFRKAGGWFSLFADEAEDDGQVQSPVAVALGALQQYYRWSRVLPAAPALDRILGHSGYLALAATSPGGVEAGDLLHAIDRVRRVVSSGQTLADAARALEEDLEASSEVESLPLEPGRSDVVRLMNLHKAKGLEAPVVFLADPCGGFAPRVDVRIIREGATARGSFQMTCTFGQGKKLIGEPAGWAQDEAEEREYLEAEETRLLYVAATRARETLIIGRWPGSARNSAWARLAPYLKGATELPVPDIVAVPPTQHVDLSSGARAAAESARRSAHDRVRATPWSVTSVTAEARHIAKMARAAEPVAADDPTRVVVRDSPSHRADAGIAWGTLVHALLEHAMRHRDATRDDLRRLAQWLTVEEPQVRPVIDDAVETVRMVARSEFWQQAQGAERSEETPFAFMAQPGVGMLGVIDLMFRTGEGWQVIDYKTDVAPGSELAEKYAAQLDAYRCALTACGLTRVNATLVPVRASTPTRHGT